MVSVVIPAYNAEAHIRETLESALAQTYRNLDVVVVDDGSEDGTAGVVQSIAAKDGRVRLLSQPNRGPAAARNAGIAQARGALVAPLDADDLWHPDKIVKQVEAMRRAGPRVGLVYCWATTIDRVGRFVGRPANPATYERDVYAQVLLRCIDAPSSTSLIRKTCLEEIGGFDESLRACEEIKLCLEIAEHCDFAVVPEFLAGIRFTSASLSRDVLLLKRCHDAVRAEAHRRHPDVPDCLFRWVEADICFWLAHRSIRIGRVWTGFRLLLRGLIRDPMLCLRSVVWRAGGKALSRLRRGSGGDSLGQHFFATSPKPDESMASTAGWLDRRRHAYAAGICVRTSVSGSRSDFDKPAGGSPSM